MPKARRSKSEVLGAVVAIIKKFHTISEVVEACGQYCEDTALFHMEHDNAPRATEYAGMAGRLHSLAQDMRAHSM